MMAFISCCSMPPCPQNALKCNKIHVVHPAQLTCVVVISCVSGAFVDDLAVIWGAGCISTLVASNVLLFHFHGGEHYYLCFDPAACGEPFVRLFASNNSAGISTSLGFESLLCFLSCFFSPMTLLMTFSHFRAELQPSLALLFCLTGKSYSELCSCCFWSQSWHLHLWDSGVFSS